MELLPQPPQRILAFPQVLHIQALFQHVPGLLVPAQLVEGADAVEFKPRDLLLPGIQCLIKIDQCFIVSAAVQLGKACF